MKANKTLGLIATALTALACVLPSPVHASVAGDIRRISVIDEKDPMRDFRANPLVAGETVTIKLYMLNRDWPSVYTNSAHCNTWQLKWIYTGIPTDLGETMDSMRPQLGLWISGGLHFATMKNFPQPCEEEGWLGNVGDVSGKVGRYYSVWEFEYKAQNGDFATPIQLANKAGTGPAGGTMGVGDGSHYYLKNVNAGGESVWALVPSDGVSPLDDEKDSPTCEFYFGAGSEVPGSPEAGDGESAWHYDDFVRNNKEAADVDLSTADVCVQAVDLDSTYSDEETGVWRGIQQGQTSATPSLPAIDLGTDGVPTKMRVYYWTDNENVIEPAGANVSTYTFVEYDEATGVAKTTTKDRKVGYVDVKPGWPSQTFLIKAVGEVDQTARVFMSFCPTNVFGLSNQLLSNFVVRTVQVITPPPPSITVTVTPNVVSTSTDNETPVASLDVELSEAYTSDLTVTLVPAVKSDSTIDPFDYIGIEKNAGGVWWAKETTVRIDKGKTHPDVPLSIYANRADDNTSGAGKGITITPTVTGVATNTFKPANWKGATLTIGTSKPQILSPVEGKKYESVLSNESHTYDIQIADAAGDLTNTYMVIWYNTGSGISATYSNLTAKTVGGVPNVLQVTHTLGNTTEAVKTYNSTFKIINSDGVPSDMRKITVEVQPKKKVTAILSKTGDSFPEGEILDVEFKFNEAFEDKEEAYVFLVPQDEATSNLVSNSTATNGLKIVKGFDKPNGKVNLELKDGFNGCYARFAIVVRTEKDITQGEVLSEWAGELSFGINNVVPGVTAVWMSNRKLTTNGGTMSSTAAIGVTKRFKAGTDEPSTFDLDSTNNPFKTEWSFEDGNNTFVTNVLGSPFDLEVLYAFNNPGTNLVTVKFRDKDMTAQEFARVKEFSFYVNTLAQPAIELSAFNGTTTFKETDYGSSRGRINVHLTDAPTEPITVGINLKKIGDEDADNYPLPVLSTKYVDIKKGTQDGFFYLSDIDGTELTEKKGFLLTASVTNKTENDDGKPWSDLYQHDSLEIQIQNEPPIIAGVETTNETLIAANVPFTIAWSVSDIDADLTNGFSAVWTTSEGASFEYKGIAATKGVFTNTFTSAGKKTVTLVVTDKDAVTGRGTDTRTYYYYVSPSKGLYIYPQGPKASGQSKLATEYINAAQNAGGLGKGRAYADGALSSVQNFTHLWNYSPEKAEAHAWAWGYKSGEEDNEVPLTRRVALDPTGTSFPENSPSNDASFYTYDNAKDSFFYAWVVSSAEKGKEAGAMPEGAANVKPYKGDPNYDAEQTAALAEYEEETVSYPSVIFEPIFALEYRIQDNLGDINQDGIPDMIAVASNKGGKLYELVAAPAADDTGAAGGEVSVSDMADVSAYNGDNDFWPLFLSDSSTPSWAEGKPFKAIDEVRGMHEGLNYRPKEGGAMVSDIWISDTERLALECAFAEARTNGWTSAADANAFMKSGAWSPENPTDPTVADSDNDGISDAIEYYIWYMATVGDVKDGKWTRLTGSRFTIDTYGRGETIPSEVVAYAFNPNRKRPVDGHEKAYYDQFTDKPVLRADGTQWEFDVTDFDEDGLLDIEEVVLGTNPINWDTDADGISDYWEVINGLDPLEASDGNRALPNSSAKNNPDHDFMAWLDGDKMTVYAVTAEDKTTYWAFNAAQTPAEGEDGVDRYKVTVGETVYWFEQPPVTATIGEKTVLASSTYAEIDLNGALGRKVLVEAGVEVAVEMTEDDSPAPKVTNGRKKALLSGEALQVFRYGRDDVEYGNDSLPIIVPVSIDGETLGTIPDGAVIEEIFEAQLVYIHHQVFRKSGGFDPRTGWFANDQGFVAARWSKITEGQTGVAINTKPYTSLDEFLVLAYRWNVKAAGDVEEFRAARDIEKDAGRPLVKLFWGEGNDLGGTTVPVFQLTNTVGVLSNAYGADTDGDGVPDGWELYVNINANDAKDASNEVLAGTAEAREGDGLDDNLSFVSEYAGTDSCNAYADVESIYKNHPGNVNGWFNKFFPTNPYAGDSDGDGLSDSEEMAKDWLGRFYAWGHDYPNTKMSFIYGSPSDDGNSCCIRGGGLNPCTVDTDQDLLPDGWEYEFAGIVCSGSNPGISDKDFDLLMRGEGLHQPGASNVNGQFVLGGMDGTWDGDCSLDFDCDGLMNYQEYLVQSLRHLRYDDAETPLMGREVIDVTTGEKSRFIKFLPMQTWDGDAFAREAREAGFTGATAYEFANLGYFTRPPMAWDRLFLSMSPAATMMVVYGNPMDPMDPRNGYRVMLPPNPILADGTRARDNMKSMGRGFGAFYADQHCLYASTDPRQSDSDGDGMDDYYELFHGLNPLLGSTANPLALVGPGGEPNMCKYDRIAMLYATAGAGMAQSAITSWQNAWAGWDNDKEPALDAIAMPWMMGTAEADADGDGLRNSEEALKSNLTAPANPHTDPSPAWYTDSTSLNKASYVSQYYSFDPHYNNSDNADNDPMKTCALLYYPWGWNKLSIAKDSTLDGKSLDYLFAFEENEGYDTDHDFKSDSEELVKTVSSASDPLDSTDPNRRQAIYFPAGGQSAAVTYGGRFLPSFSLEWDLLRQFTVEAWIRPELSGQEQVIFERVADYSQSTLSNNTSVIRANFRVGLDAAGRIFAEFQGSTADSAVSRLIGNTVELDKWTHVAAAFDGSTFSLYMNGSPLASDIQRFVGQMPATGVIIDEQDPQAFSKTALDTGYTGYKTVPTAFIVGASALTRDALKLTPDTTWDSFQKPYQGYVDEIRVWDGARTATEIHDSYKIAYTLKDAAAERQKVYEAWARGARRNATLGVEVLPAELVQHYSFGALAGAVDPADVAVTPSGFTQKVVDNVRVNGDKVPGGIGIGWWLELPIRSTVYWDPTYVPWINNTVRHLPAMDGSVLDSAYWSENVAGMLMATEAGLDAYDFPNSANPYAWYFYSYDRYYHKFHLNHQCEFMRYDLAVEMQNKWAFDQRSGFLGTSDLVPLGDAFAKRADEMWDGYGSADAWEITGDDLDCDGLPDWWEVYAMEHGYTTETDSDVFTWSSEVDYDGHKMTAAQAYQRDLQKGMLPGGSIDETYEINTTGLSSTADLNKNGLPDWWERLFSIVGDADDDDDGDGLSNLSEFNVYNEHKTEPGFFLNPGNAFSDGQILDYFKQFPDTNYLDNVVYTNYLGGRYTDHDFIDDTWESIWDVDGINRWVYDADKDSDNDGWSNWAEARALTDPTHEALLSLVSASYNEDHRLGAYPVPTVKAAITYNGDKVLDENIVVNAWRGSSVEKMPDGIWTVPGAGGESRTGIRFLGLNPGRKIKLTIGPGMIAMRHCTVEFLDPNMYDVDTSNGTVTLYTIDTALWTGLSSDEPDQSQQTEGKVVRGFLGGGTVDYTTGETELDFTQYQDTDFTIGIGDNKVRHLNLRDAFVRVTWKNRIVVYGNTKMAYLSETDEAAAENDKASSRSEGEKKSLGYLREGKNTFVAFADTNGNGVFDKGEPFGMARDVDVGWDAVPDLAIELHHGFSFVLPGLGTEVGVRVYRTKINGMEAEQPRVVWSKNVDTSARNWFTSDDMIKSGEYDFDWRTLVADAKANFRLQPEEITSVEYEVRVDGVTVDTYLREFDTARVAPVCVSPTDTSDYLLLKSQPTFTWNGTGTASAFELQIAKDANFSDIVYDSGISFLAVNRTFTAPAYVGEQLEDGTNYFWRVAELNAQYTTPVGGWSTAAKFRTDVSSDKFDTGYGKLGADVRYYGAATNGTVVVGVYKTGDFTGRPIAMKTLGDVTSLDLAVTKSNWIQCETNVVFDGIAPGNWYVMAFIDVNGDKIRQPYESWGYLNGIGGGDSRNLYTPMTLNVNSTFGDLPIGLVVMEDTDINQDEIPDCIEGWLINADSDAGDGPALGDDSDGDGLTNGEEQDDSMTDALKIDTDGDGMWDGWEYAFAGAHVDPTIADGDFVVDGDVMAYAQTNMTVIILWDGKSENSLVPGLVALGSLPVRPGDEARSLDLRTLWQYGNEKALGVAPAANAYTGYRVYSVTNEMITLVHAQVYEAFGYNPLTANPVAFAASNAVNTKAFTALDKYLLIKYFEQMGFCDEKTVNKNRSWADYSLKPGDPDCNRDGIPDGWELYTMFGPRGSASVSKLSNVQVSPFATVKGVVAAQYARDASKTPDAGGLALVNEWDFGNNPTDPWNKNTFMSDVTDVDAWSYHLKTAESQLADEDHDGLSNWQEYLAKSLGVTISVTNSYSRGNVLDYFIKVGDKYLAECLVTDVDSDGEHLLADHDFMEDWIEDGYNVATLTRWVYDPRNDGDDDGWSNWSEVRAGTDPSRTAALSIDEIEVPEYPVPSVVTKIAYNGSQKFSSVVLQAKSERNRYASREPAVWSIGYGVTDAAEENATGDAENEDGEDASANAGHMHFFGMNPCKIVTFNMGPGSVKAGSIHFWFKDVGYQTESLTKVKVDYLQLALAGNMTSRSWVEDHSILLGSPSTAEWYSYVWDRQREGSTEWGDLVSTWTRETIGTINYQTGVATIDLGQMTEVVQVNIDSQTETQTGTDADGNNSTITKTKVKYRIEELAKSYVKATWESKVLAESTQQAFYLSQTDSGHLMEGLNTFTAFGDVNGNGVYDAGEPYGVVRHVDVGWSKAEEVVFELTDEAAAFDRFTLASDNDEGITGEQRVRIYRTAINGMAMESKVSVWTTKVDLGKHGMTFTEADFTSEGAWDLDWDYLRTDAGRLGVTPDAILSVDYEVRVGTNVVGTFTKNFSSKRVVPVTTGMNIDGSGKLLSAQPTFTWKGAEGSVAYVLQIATDENFSNIVWDSGTNFLPGVSTTLGRSVKPGVWVGDQLDDDTTYFWRVAELNAKYSYLDAGAWSAAAQFTTAISSEKANTGRGSLAVQVRYYGPAKVSLDNVIVGVYDSPDFAGLPVARKHMAASNGKRTVADLGYTGMNWATVIARDVNVTFDGVEPGDWYVMAFVDSNTNGVRDAWETWGYVNKVGTESKDLYTPVSMTVVSTKENTPVAFLVMEDTDANQDGLPDVEQIDVFEDWEDPEDINTDDPSEDVDPSDEENETAISGDVMAYYDTTMMVVVIDGSAYAIANPEIETLRASEIVPGIDASQLKSLRVTWSNNGVLGIGVQKTFPAGAKVTDVMQGATVRLVHAQVYSAFGFNPLTANGMVPEADRVNTKPFTAADRALVGDYLKAMGYTDVDVKFDANRIDADNDGIPDGWELYVMFGSGSEMKISPFDATDALTIAPGTNSMLTLVQEWDGGRKPTDPWSLDTDKDGITDASAYTYYLKDGYRADEDNDQLSNLAEYIITKGFGFAAVKADRMSSLKDQVVPDYFLRVGTLYLGEMFADHDWIEDWYEDQQPVQIGGDVKLDNYSRFKWDAKNDADNDGWSNWAEARAAIEKGYRTVVDGIVSNAQARAFTNAEKAEASAFEEQKKLEGLWIKSEDRDTSAPDEATFNRMVFKTVSYYEITTNTHEELAYDGVPTPTVKAHVVFNGDGLSSNAIVIRAWSQTKDPQCVGVPDARWTMLAPNQNALDTTFELKECDPTGGETLALHNNGSLREGLNTFTVFADCGVTVNGSTVGAGDGLFQPGEPFGVVRDVDVGWKSGSFTVELTEINPSIVRIDLQQAYALLQSSGGGSTNQAEGATFFDALNVGFTDRGALNARYNPNAQPYYTGTNALPSDANLQVRVSASYKNIRTLDNTYDFGGVALFDISKAMVDATFTLSKHPVLTEADLLNGALDLDWGASYLNDATNMLYKIVTGTDVIDGSKPNNNLMLFVNNFETTRTKATPVAPLGGIVNAARPTFIWRHDCAVKDYPAFQLKVFVKDTTNVVYDSGALKVPARNANGEYQWTAPAYADMVTPERALFSTTNNYDWSVTMLDAKFTTFDSSASKASFRFNTSGLGGGLADYGSIQVAVKYFGPAFVDSRYNAPDSLIHVQAFESPDFAGAPVAEGWVRNTESLTTTNAITLNARLIGLSAGTYYVRAFLDSNGNGVKDDWESWGYGCYIGTDRTDVYTPRGYTIGDKEDASFQMPECVVYLEDCDTDQDWLPDAWEMETEGDLVARKATTGDTFIVAVDKNLQKSLTALQALKIVDALPISQALVEVLDGDTTSSLAFAAALAGIPSQAKVDPVVKITSFSLEDGIELEVEAPIKVDGQTLKPSLASSIKGVNLKVTLLAATALDGTWTEYNAGTITVPVSETTTRVPDDQMKQINDAIDAAKKKAGSACFFKVKVDVK